MARRGHEPETTAADGAAEGSRGRREARSLRAVPDLVPVATLPPRSTELVGRADELALLRAALVAGEHALVTITGPGGVGKTTLAIDVAHAVAGAFESVVHYVSLTFATEPDTVLAAIAATVGAAGWERGDREAVREHVVAGLAEPALLVLDNCEQVAGLDGLLADLLVACPALTVLATSRRAIHIPGERIVTLDPLPVPRPTDRLGALTRNPAVQLLRDAARRVDPQFVVTAGNAPAVAEICIRLDGLPLALELAAARLRLVAPSEIVQLLERRFDLLHGATSGAVAHHRRLRETIAWSYELLSPDDRARFRVLGVFTDGFGLAAAAAVAGVEPVSMLDTLDDLVDHHLVRSVKTPEGAGRFELLESTREFALDELVRCDEMQAVRVAHAAWYARLAARWGPAIADPGAQLAALAALDAELENLRAAIAWSLDHGPADQALRLPADLWRYWWTRGLAVEGRARVEAALADERSMAEGSPLAVARALQAAGDLAEVRGDLHGAAALLERAVTAYIELDDAVGLAATRNSLAIVWREQGRLADAHELHEAAAATFGALGDDRSLAVSTNGLGAIAYRRGDHAAARAHWTAVLEIMERIGDRLGAATLRANLGVVCVAGGDPFGAITHLTASLAVREELGDVAGTVADLLNLAEAETFADRLDAAEAHIDRAAALAAETGHGTAPFIVPHHRAVIAGRRGAVGEAAAHYLAALRAALAGAHPIETVEALEAIGVLVAELGDGDDGLARACLAAARAGRTATGGASPAAVVRCEQRLGAGGAPVGEPLRWPDAAQALLAPLAEIAAAQRAVLPGDRPAAPLLDPLLGLGLTAREAEVVRLLVAHKTDREIAAELYVSVRTVTTHVSAVLRKLAVTSRRAVAGRLTELGVPADG